MKILLVNPTTHFEIVGNNPTALEESRGFNPPLGLLLLAGYLEKHSDYEVKILDALAEQLTFRQIADRIESYNADVVGITTMTQTVIDVMRITEIVKARTPHAKVVLGGPHVHLFPEETIQLPGVDFLVRGEGEISFHRMLGVLDDPKALKEIPGLTFIHRKKIVSTGLPAFIEDLDSLPFPARHMINVHNYDSVLSPRNPTTTIFTSRGCPYVCSFCDRPHLGKKFRARSARNVVDEMEECIRLGIHEFLVYDDTFTVRRQRVIDICNEILARNLDVGFDIRARVDTVDKEMLALLAKAGCRGVHFGIEAGTPKILEVLKKGITIELAERVFNETKEAGMQVLAYFMIGAPTETRTDIMETFRVSRALDPDFIHLTVLTPFPGTAIYEQGLKDGIFTHDVWREFANNPNMGFVPPYWPENFSLDELNTMLVKGYKQFYRRPEYLVKRLRAIRTPYELVRKGKAGLRILTMKNKSETKGSF